MKKTKLLREQIDLQEKIQDNGVNLVTCGHCGNTLLHEVHQVEITCWACLTEMEVSNCPDVYFKEMIFFDNE